MLQNYAFWSTFFAWNHNTEEMKFKMFGPVCMNILLVDFPPIQARRSWMPSRQRLRLHRPAPPHGAGLVHLLDIILPATSLVTMVTSSLVTRLLLAALHHLPSQHSPAVANQSGMLTMIVLELEGKQKQNSKETCERFHSLLLLFAPHSQTWEKFVDYRFSVNSGKCAVNWIPCAIKFQRICNFFKLSLAC